MKEWQAPTELLLDGVWQKTERRFPVVNPATGEPLAEVADASAKEARLAVDAAERSFQSWRLVGAYRRSAVLRRWFELIQEDRENLAALITWENGKPYKEALAEVAYAASFVEWFAEEAKRLYGRVVAATSPEKRITVLRQPVGVVAAITPWNFPAAMVTRKVAPALAVGCTVVLKPAEETPLTALRLAELLQEAGAPPGVLNVLPTHDPVPVADTWLADRRVRKITFTGSTAVGKELMQKASQNLQRLSLELGGQAPFIVFQDADLDVVLRELMTAKFRNTGQSCIAANRVLVATEIAEAFTERVVGRVARLKVGEGFEPDVDVGPLIDERAREKVRRHVADAREKGARLLYGGDAPSRPGFFVTPTVLAGVTPSMLVMREETFGPVIAVATFRSEEEAVSLANDTPYGLAAYFFTRDVSRAWRVAEALDYGIVGLNDGGPSTAQAPFGGLKESGMGREGGMEGAEAFLETKYVSWGAVGTGLLEHP